MFWYLCLSRLPKQKERFASRLLTKIMCLKEVRNSKSLVNSAIKKMQSG